MLSSVFLFLDIGGGEFMLILFVALLLFGGDKLPELAKGLGKGIRDFKDASEGVKREINNQIDSYESKKKDEDEAKRRKEASMLTDGSEESSATEEEYKAPETHVANTVPVSESYAAGDQYEEYQYHDGYNPDEYHNSNPRTAQELYDDTFKNQEEDTNVSTEPVNKETKV